MNTCVHCKKRVRPRQHTVKCTFCSALTHRCCGIKLKMDHIEYFKYKRGEVGIVFQCEICTLGGGLPYNGEIEILKQSSIDIRVSTFSQF